MIYTCCNHLRGEAVRKHATLNGVEFLEVLDDDAPTGTPRQCTLLVRCYKPVTGIATDQVRVTGGARIRPVRVLWALVAADPVLQGLLTPSEAPLAALVLALDAPSDVLVVRTEFYGDFSNYTLRLVKGIGDDSPNAAFDPVLSTVEFSFKAECPTPFDCLQPRSCPAPFREQPNIDYLAKDYASFRRVILDRMALLAPTWRERNPADVGISLVEMLAYVGDSLSYEQDAIATEAYLHTARLRVSARRHARLVDYFMHDGANARAWVQVQASARVVVPKQTQFVTRAQQLQGPIAQAGSRELLSALNGGAETFEAMERLVTYPQNNTMFFYTWSDTACALPKCATHATLRDDTAAGKRLRLRRGDVLIFEERLGPKTGVAADADPGRRHAVRLTRVEPEATLVLEAESQLEIDRTPGPLQRDPLTNTPIVKIEWDEEDALPFPLCISSSQPGSEIAGQVYSDVSIASGNVLLADHGRTVDHPEFLGTVAGPSLFAVSDESPVLCAPEDEHALMPRYRPRLAQGPVSQVGHVRLKRTPGSAVRMPFDPAGSASSAFEWDVRRTVPAVTASLPPATEVWTPERDLLDSKPEDLQFVVEVESDGAAALRFGDGENGRRPAAGTAFEASYRVGNGARGNVGREAIANIVAPGPGQIAAVEAVRNPLPAKGGVEPETIEEVRQKAPAAFRTQERAVTSDDYVAAATRLPALQGAAAQFRWTGSWRTVFATIDPYCQDSRDGIPALAADVRKHLERFRLAGYDLVVDPPRYVSLEIEFHVCVKPGYFASDVEASLLDIFTSGTQPDGSPGLFHPDRFTFGQPVYTSPLLAAALGVAGVYDVRLLTFRRMGQADGGKALADGRILLHRLEIARLSNDPNFPESGTFHVTLEGGR